MYEDKLNQNYDDEAFLVALFEYSDFLHTVGLNKSNRISLKLGYFQAVFMIDESSLR